MGHHLQQPNTTCIPQRHPKANPPPGILKNKPYLETRVSCEERSFVRAGVNRAAIQGRVIMGRARGDGSGAMDARRYQ